jgi:hypothetical protein
MLDGTEPQFRDGHISHIFWVDVDSGHLLKINVHLIFLLAIETSIYRT